MDRWKYNCGGYALETYDWFVPYYRGGYIDKAINWEFADHREFHEEFVKYILEKIPKLRLIEKVEDIGPNEEAIAFRTGVTDFHFVVRPRPNLFIHKPGNTAIQRMPSKNFYAKEGWSYGVYDGPITWFARPKREKYLFEE